MSKNVLLPLVAAVVLGAAGCHAEAKIGSAEPKAATPPPPPPAPPPPPPPAPEPEKKVIASKPIRALGRAKVENNEIKIPGKVHFDTDKATLKDDKETKEILQTVADVMKENTQITKLRIEGHTDDQGAADHNEKLSQERSQAVVDWLAKAGVDKARLDSKGWGPTHPIVKNDNATNREMNRRVEFKLWEVDGKATEAQKTADQPPALAESAAAVEKKDEAAAAAAKKKEEKKPAAVSQPAAPKK